MNKDKDTGTCVIITSKKKGGKNHRVMIDQDTNEIFIEHPGMAMTLCACHDGVSIRCDRKSHFYPFDWYLTELKATEEYKKELKEKILKSYNEISI